MEIVGHSEGNLVRPLAIKSITLSIFLSFIDYEMVSLRRYSCFQCDSRAVRYAGSFTNR